MREVFAKLDRRDEIEAAFCKPFADVPLQDIANYYGENTAKRVQTYFKEHPSPRFLWIQGGCVGQEPGAV